MTQAVTAVTRLRQWSTCFIWLWALLVCTLHLTGLHSAHSTSKGTTFLKLHKRPEKSFLMQCTPRLHNISLMHTRKLSLPWPYKKWKETSFLKEWTSNKMKTTTNRHLSLEFKLIYKMFSYLFYQETSKTNVSQIFLNIGLSFRWTVPLTTLLHYSDINMILCRCTKFIFAYLDKKNLSCPNIPS